MKCLAPVDEDSQMPDTKIVVPDTNSQSPFISVLVPAFNEAAELPRMLTSVQEAFAAIGRTDFEVVVCDNNSSDATADIASAQGARVVFETHNQIARARNAAAKAARGEWFKFIDADSVLSPELLTATLSDIQSGKSLGGGARVAFDRDSIPLYIRAGLASWNSLSRSLRWAAGAYIYCSRPAFESTGGFDERVYASEEIGFSRKLKRLARKERKQFHILQKTPILTSARKADQFTFGQTVLQVLRCAWPGSLRRRDRCGFWYRRGPAKQFRNFS